MKDAQKPDHVSLNTLVNYLRDGRFVIPDFQREFEWKPWDIRELMRSIFLDYYIGSLLLWKGKPENFAALSCEPVYGYTGSGKPEYIVLDGQQRLTAMYYAFLAPDVPLPNRVKPLLLFRPRRQVHGRGVRRGLWLRLVHAALGQSCLPTRRPVRSAPVPVLGHRCRRAGNCPTGFRDTKHTGRPRPQRQTRSEMTEAAQTRSQSRRRTRRSLASTSKGITGQYQISYIELDQGSRGRQGLRHLHADQQPRHSPRRVRSDERPAQAEGTPAQADVADAAPRLESSRPRR